jgi:hypothetical protein
MSPENSSANTTAPTHPTVSTRLVDGRLVELTVAPSGDTRLTVWDGSDWRHEASLSVGGGPRLVPYSRNNSLIRNRIALFPSQPDEFGTKAELVERIATYIRRYVDLSAPFLRIVSNYVLLTWVYDHFNELPYIRLQGDFGSGKTRFLLVVGSICYKPIFASGASTVSPIFHMLDIFRGTLLIDEADFRYTDERAQIVKILNNGNARGFPVLRTESKNGHEFSPRAFTVFGPKLVGMRSQFDDPALESRFLTERSERRILRGDIPINLPDAYADEALALRNQLLLFRFRSEQARYSPASLDERIEPRLRQIFNPLAAVAEDSAARADLLRFARASDNRLRNERRNTVEAQLLALLQGLVLRSSDRPVALRDIAAAFASTSGNDFGSVSNRWIGDVLRKRLGISTHKSHGTFAVPVEERPRIAALCERYGITDIDAAEVLASSLAGEKGDLGEEEPDTAPRRRSVHEAAISSPRPPHDPPRG